MQYCNAGAGRLTDIGFYFIFAENRKEMKIKEYISELNLAELPLALCGTVLGIMLAAADYHVNPLAASFTILTAAFIYLLARAARISVVFKRLMAALVILTALLSIRFSFGTIFSLESFVLLLTGSFIVRYAMKYCSGTGSGKVTDELLLFLFSGFAGVFVAYFVATHSFGNRMLMLPAAFVGFLTLSVHNLVNIRDMECKGPGRMSFAVRLGAKGSRIYQTLLTVFGIAAMTVYACMRIFDLWHFLYLVIVPVLLWTAVVTWRRSGSAMDRNICCLKVTVPLACLLSGLGFLMFLIG